jgi:hypothetical protein
MPVVMRLSSKQQFFFAHHNFLSRIGDEAEARKGANIQLRGRILIMHFCSDFKCHEHRDEAMIFGAAIWSQMDDVFGIRQLGRRDGLFGRSRPDRKSDHEFNVPVCRIGIDRRATAVPQKCESSRAPSKASFASNTWQLGGGESSTRHQNRNALTGLRARHIRTMSYCSWL